MSEIDDAIREALSRDDAAFLANFEKEPGLFGEVIDVFRGPMGWINIVMVIVMLPLFGFVFYAGWKFATLEDLRAMAHWGAMGAVAIIVVTLLRLWFWMEMHTNRVLREVKRLELQVARLVAPDAV